MTVEISDAIIKQTGLTPQQVLIELAVHLFENKMITVGQGGDMTGLGHVGFQRELGARQIPLHYDLAEWEQDKLTLEKLRQL